jgi:hypothetical protein
MKVLNRKCHTWMLATMLTLVYVETSADAQRANSADGKKRSFLTVRWNDWLGGI